MANFVQEYMSTDLNAPVLNGITGSMTTLLETGTSMFIYNVADDKFYHISYTKGV